MRATDWAWIGNRYRGCSSILTVFATLVVADGSRRDAETDCLAGGLLKLQLSGNSCHCQELPPVNSFCSRLFSSSAACSPLVSPQFLALRLPSLSRRFITQLGTDAWIIMMGGQLISRCSWKT